MNRLYCRGGLATLWGLFLSMGLVSTLTNAQQHAHTHGQLTLDTAIDAQSITLQIESPLESFLGFERAPRTDAETKQVAEMVARLKTADQIFQPDPAAECKLSTVEISSAVLGLGDAKEKPAHTHDEGKNKGVAHKDDEHADIDVTAVFSCNKASAARYVDVKLFEAFKGIRVISAQVASPQGQFKRTLNAKSPILTWER
jgi:hypothetical protein